jgi:phage FluMu protein Com
MAVKDFPTDKELDRTIAIAKQQKQEKHLEKQREVISKTKCRCGTFLKLNPDDFIILDGRKHSRRVSVECPKCKHLNDVKIYFPDDPRVVDAQIRVNRGGFKWEQENIRIKDLNKEQIGAWIKSEKEKVKNGSSKQSRVMQMLLAYID